MTNPREWSEHTKFTVTVGSFITILVAIISGTMWMTRAIDSLTESTKRIEQHIGVDWGLREEIVQYKNQRMSTPEIRLVDPRETWKETHWKDTLPEAESNER